MNFKNKLEDYSEEEFLEILHELFTPSSTLSGSALEKHRITIVRHFIAVTEHPEGSDVIFYPPVGADDSPQGVVNRVKEWRAANGKPGFKPA